MAELQRDTIIGPFRIIRELTRGKDETGMSRVFEVRRVDIEEAGVTYALKVTRAVDPHAPDAETRQNLYHDALANEVEVLRQLKHPHIVHLLPIPNTAPVQYIARATELDDQPWYCVEEYLSGGSLADYIASVRGSRLAPAEAVEIVYQIALALDYIHAKGFAHLDVKPDNILFRRPFQPGTPFAAVLIDFGIARREAQTGLTAGAATYLAPERIRFLRGELPREQALNQRPADVFALGVILYRIVTGHLPFARRDQNTTTETILSAAPTPLTQYAHDPEFVRLEPVLERALDKDPAKRLTIPEFLNALDELMLTLRATAPAPAAAAEPPPPAPVVTRPRRAVAPILLGVLIGLFVIIIAVSALSAAISAGSNVTPTAIAPSPTVATSLPATATPPAPTRTPTEVPTATPVATFTPGAVTPTPIAGPAVFTVPAARVVFPTNTPVH